MRVALYARVSTDEQDATNQLAALTREAERRGWTIVRTWRLDALSAYKGQQEEALGEILAAARRREFDILMVWAVDRLERRGILATSMLLRDLFKAGLTVVSLQEAWVEQTGPMRDLLLALFAWMAQQESSRRSERTLAGNARRKANGLPVGRQPGAKDKGPRKRSGYFKRYETEREGQQTTQRQIRRPN